MSQIKKIVKPGDQIRGAKVGVAGLDKDGNVIGTGATVDQIPPKPTESELNNVLTATANGPKWIPSSPGSGKYAHYIHVKTPSITNNLVTLLIINTSADEINTGELLKTALETGGHISESTSVLASGIIGNSTVRQFITSVYKDNDAINFISFTRFDGGNWILSPAEASFSTLSNLTVTDYVVTL